MAKKTPSATGQQAQQPDQAEQKLPAGQQGGEHTRSGRTFRPRVDTRETERGLVLLADVPGARPDGLTITLDRRALNVHAQVEDHAPKATAQSTRNTRSVILHVTLRCRATS